MYHVTTVLYSHPDLRLTLVIFTQKLPNICPRSIKTIHIAGKTLGGLTARLSKWWMAECGLTAAVVMGTTRWSRLAHHCYLGNLCYAVWDRGSASFSKWMIFNKMLLISNSRVEGNENLLCKSNSQTTPAWYLTYRSPHCNMKGRNELHWQERTVTHFQFKYRL